MNTHTTPAQTCEEENHAGSEQKEANIVKVSQQVLGGLGLVELVEARRKVEQVPTQRRGRVQSNEKIEASSPSNGRVGFDG